MSGYCETCQSDVYGYEVVRSCNPAPILMFIFITGGVSISLNDIDWIMAHNIRYELYCIIQRVGASNCFGHNFCVCREYNDKWVDYNDQSQRTRQTNESIVSNSYILVFAASN